MLYVSIRHEVRKGVMKIFSIRISEPNHESNTISTGLKETPQQEDNLKHTGIYSVLRFQLNAYVTWYFILTFALTLTPRSEINISTFNATRTRMLSHTRLLLNDVSLKRSHCHHKWGTSCLLKLASEIYYNHVIRSEGRYCVFCPLELPHTTPGRRSLNEISHQLLCSSGDNRMEGQLPPSSTFLTVLHSFRLLTLSVDFNQTSDGRVSFYVEVGLRREVWVGLCPTPLCLSFEGAFVWCWGSYCALVLESSKLYHSNTPLK
jgi:hypothetical protein